LTIGHPNAIIYFRKLKYNLQGRVKFPTGGNAANSPLARELTLTRCDSGADSKVWMGEDRMHLFPWDYIAGNFNFQEVSYMNHDVNKLVKLALLTALSIMLMMAIRFPIIPSAPFLEYEPGDVPALIGTFLYGPGAGLLITAAVSLFQATTVSAGSGWIGAVMHIVATGTMVLVAGAIYRRIHTFKGAVLALLAGTIGMTLMMIPLNLYFTTKFLGVPVEAVKAMIVPVIIPFNVIKASANSALTVLVYKSVAKVLRIEPAGGEAHQHE
jgi:riboflavin transporter FmnP